MSNKFVTCALCASPSERGLNRDYCTNTHCAFYDSETHLRYDMQKPIEEETTKKMYHNYDDWKVLWSTHLI